MSVVVEGGHGGEPRIDLVAEVAAGERLSVRVADGSFDATVAED